jgi:membrane-associated phospholipid phosphatase
MAATRSGDEPGPWVWSKVKGILVESIAHDTATSLTTYLKDAVGRERPDGSDHRSFPSGLATESFAAARLGSENLPSTDLPSALQTPVRAGLYTMAIGASWARVEAGGHFPSDVLFAAGATNFLAGFVHDAFLGIGAQPGLVVSRGPDGDGWEVGLVWNH